MKKCLSVLLILVMIFSLAACGNSSDKKEPGGEKSSGDGSEVAQIIVSTGTVDDKSYNQGAWEGITAFAEDNNLTCKYYKSTEDTVDAYIKAIDLAVKGGAKIVVCAGYVFEPAIFKAQDVYPDIKFVLLDGTPQDGTYTEYRTEKNVSSVLYAEQQAGFLAGYAAIKEGYRKLGFMGGMAVPAVERYGYGYVAGADYAAKELGLAKADIEMKYTYVGNYDASPENQTTAASWYQGGTEIIFAAGGPMGNSVMAAAEQYKGEVIGVDSDQSSESETVITSAMKMLKNSVYQILDLYKQDKFPGGETTTFDVKLDGVSLPMETSRFTKFTQDNYKEIYDALVNDTDGIAENIPDDTKVDSVTDIQTSVVSIEEIGK